MDKITILTNQINVPFDERITFKTILKKILFLNTIRKIISMRKSCYGGHYAVTRSLVEGLKKIHAEFNYNPSKIDKVGKVVVVLSNIEALRQAIKWKKEGRIKKLLAGPNLAMLPSEIKDLEYYQLIDAYLHPSQFIIDWWSSLDPNFGIKQVIWFAGVNQNEWFTDQQTKYNILIYEKKCQSTLINYIKDYLTVNHYQYSIIKYGEYTKEQYKIALANSKLVIYLSPSESQGIALFEAWAANVPTLVWNRKYFKWNNYTGPGTSAPYLSELTGQAFQNQKEFISQFNSIISNLNLFKPAQWIKSNGTDEICAQNLIHLIKTI